MECLICNSNNQKKIFSKCVDLEYKMGGEHNFYKCLNCRLVYMDPLPTITELLSFYPSDYHGYVKSFSMLTNFLIGLNIKARANLYQKLIGRKGKILEIGSAEGSHFSLLKKYGDWEFWGIEFNNEIAEMGRKMGSNIVTGTVENYNFGDTKFDLIIMNNLIEHVVDPIKTLRKAKEILVPGGWIVGETPNTRSWDFYFFGRYWGGLHVPRHTFIFNQHNLGLLGRGVGLFPKIDQKIDTNHWAGSIQNFFQSKIFLKTELKNGRTGYYSFLLLLFIPLNFFQKILGFSGVIRFKMRNQNSK